MVVICDVVGLDVDIIVEMYVFMDIILVIQFGCMIEELGIFYYEELVMLLNFVQMKQVVDKVNILLVVGECIYWCWGYCFFLENGSLSVIQLDICICGGIIEVKKICDMVYVYDKMV